MSELALLFVVIGFFLAIRAVEYKPNPGIYPVCSIGAWVSFGVGLVLWLVT